MPNVTVLGALSSHVSIPFSSQENAVIAGRLASTISTLVRQGSILPLSDTSGPPQALLGGQAAEWVQNSSGTTSLPPGYSVVVDVAPSSVIYGSGDLGESVLAGTGDTTFIATGGSGAFVGGGGAERVVIPASDDGDWAIYTGPGNDQILALGAGSDMIHTGTGSNQIQLGDGTYLVQSTGDDTILAGSGAETIDATANTKHVVYGNASSLTYIAGSGPSTVIGMTGSDTILGGGGPALYRGGTGGNNLIYAGVGEATLYGGGDGDQLYAQGDQAQALYAGSGNESLVGSFATGADTFYAGSGSNQIIGGGGNDTFVAGSGAATMTAGLGTDVFQFASGTAGGTDLIAGFTSTDKLHLQGYGANAIEDALATQTASAGSVTITLSDNTQVTLSGVDHLTRNNFS